ncbi:GntR family transcriptional regulator [Saccharopolyspora sp. 6V]|uniref:GntR family transcriptional regulator n=1 Tax=Saccharopolyspora sp. 6V TaxID=2877239 RepID=UPI001CD63736|nr:GntR family transcriptional regulator [Saccharopolyspora sp. 6V]MCA1195334.1 GntR family transcriptional regulator [Saccharopolyspora sp. 6V]
MAPTLQARVARLLRSMIESGELAPGDDVPSEAEISRAHEVSRVTVRGALRQLEAEGLIESGQGRKRRVRKIHQYDHHAVFAESPDRPEGTDSFVSEATSAGLSASTDFEMRIEVPPEFVARRLRVKSDELVVVRDVLRFIGNEPFSQQTSYYPRSLAEELGFDSPGDIKPGTTRVLSENGYRETGTFDEIVSRMPSPAESERLVIGAGTPLMILTRTAVSGRTITRLTQTKFPADRHRILYEIGNYEDVAIDVEEK